MNGTFDDSGALGSAVEAALLAVHDADLPTISIVAVGGLARVSSNLHAAIDDAAVEDAASHHVEEAIADLEAILSLLKTTTERC